MDEQWPGAGSGAYERRLRAVDPRQRFRPADGVVPRRSRAVGLPGAAGPAGRPRVPGSQVRPAWLRPVRNYAPWTLEQFITDLDGLRTHFGYPRWIAGGHSFGADLALRYALRYPHRVTGLVYICGTGLEWNLHASSHKSAARARRSQREHDRLAALARHTRTPGEEREYLTLTWAADYADHSFGLAAAAEMASAGMQSTTS